MLLQSKNIILRFVEIADADFIYKLRLDEKKTKFLSKIDTTVESQIAWIKKYKEREKKEEEFYFLIQSKSNEQLGLVRVYDFKQDSFSWGSWIIKENAPQYSAIESVLLVYDFGFYTLHFNKSHFSVMKENKKVIAFHKKFGAKIIYEDAEFFYFTFHESRYKTKKLKYKKFL